MWRKRGRSAQAIGRSRGGWTTKIHALTDVVGRPYALMLTPGKVSDIKAAPALLERAGRMRYLLGDKGYDADSLRRSLRGAGAIPVIPHSVRQTAILRPPPRRECLLPPKRLSPHRYPLRQARRQLPLSRSSRNGRRLPAVNESDP
ncbi:transposase [Sphingomonas sp. PB2P12]|uniref:transposase n=1 Tax=Sphingomonas sandaracina TaxID=3096157 RepID=UPI003B579512